MVYKCVGFSFVDEQTIRIGRRTQTPPGRTVPCMRLTVSESQFSEVRALFLGLEENL